MTKVLNVAGIALLALLTLAPSASAQRGRIVVSRGFGIGRPLPYYPYGYGAWPGWGGGWGGYYAPEQVPATGNVKLLSPFKDASLKDVSVYVDGGYAGTAAKLKKFPLPLGTHDIEVRDHSGRILHQERVQVIRGKTIEVNIG